MTEAMRPRFFNGLLEIPVHHVRGGTSTGIVLDERCLPGEITLREELIRNIMGVPLAGEAPDNRQVAGLGRGVSTSNKVFIIAAPSHPGADIDSTLAQLSAGKAAIDWSVNCGNMSAALPYVAFELGLLETPTGPTRVRIHNRNTGVIAEARLVMPAPGAPLAADTEIPGVHGTWPGVALSLNDPAGSKTGKLFPTGKRIDTIGGLEVSCVDFAMPMIIVRAADFGCAADEPPEILEADGALRDRMRRLWVEAGLRMALSRDGRPMTAEELAHSETVPKVCLIAAPDQTEAACGINLRARYFTPQTCHRSMAVTGGSCLAAASLIGGTVARAVAKGLQGLGAETAEHAVKIGNPAGMLEARISGRESGGRIEIPAASYIRSAQILLRGHTPLYNASPALLDHYRGWLAAA